MWNINEDGDHILTIVVVNKEEKLRLAASAVTFGEKKKKHTGRHFSVGLRNVSQALTQIVLYLMARIIFIPRLMKQSSQRCCMLFAGGTKKER